MSSVRHDENNGAENVTGYAKDTCDMQVSVRGPHPALRSRPPTQPHHICDHVQSTHLFTHQTPTSPPITFLWQNVKAGHCFWHDDLLRLTFQRVSVALINVSRSPARKCNYGYHTPPKTPPPHAHSFPPTWHHHKRKYIFNVHQQFVSEWQQKRNIFLYCKSKQFA